MVAALMSSRIMDEALASDFRADQPLTRAVLFPSDNALATSLF
jgi:hypothetical protein